jgi:hypothetical protein
MPGGLVGPLHFYAERLDPDEKDAVLIDTPALHVAQSVVDRALADAE